MRLSSIHLLVPALLALAACGDGGGGGVTPPPATSGGTFSAIVQSPHADEGAAVMELIGSGIEEVNGAGHFLTSTPISGGRRVVLIREQAGRLEFRVRVAEGSDVPAVRFVEVAGGDDRLRTSLDGYTVAFTRVEAR